MTVCLSPADWLKKVVGGGTFGGLLGSTLVIGGDLLVIQLDVVVLLALGGGGGRRLLLFVGFILFRLRAAVGLGSCSLAVGRCRLALGTSRFLLVLGRGSALASTQLGSELVGSQQLLLFLTSVARRPKMISQLISRLIASKEAIGATNWVTHSGVTVGTLASVALSKCAFLPASKMRCVVGPVKRVCTW